MVTLTDTSVLATSDGLVSLDARSYRAFEPAGAVHPIETGSDTTDGVGPSNWSVSGPLKVEPAAVIVRTVVTPSGVMLMVVVTGTLIAAPIRPKRSPLKIGMSLTVVQSYELSPASCSVQVPEPLVEKSNVVKSVPCCE